MSFRFIGFPLAVLKLLMFKVCGITGISKIEFSFFPLLKGLNKLKKNHRKPPKLLSQPIFK